MTPFLARVALALFGPSMIGLRFFGALAAGIAMVLTGLMAREIGGKRPAQLVAAWAAAIAGPAVFLGSVFQYVSFDYLWWVLAAWITIRLVQSEDQRWWLALGVVVGLGMMTKYTMAFFLAGIGGGIVLTKPRWLLNRWLWYGATIAFLTFLPNLVWQIRHHFITLDFLKFIHARDVERGSTNGFLPAQVWSVTNPVTVPLWIAGLYFLLIKPEGKRYRMIGWMYVIPLALFLIAKGKPYYLSPAYPMLLAAGAVWGERWSEALSPVATGTVRRWFGPAWWSAGLWSFSWFCLWRRRAHAGGESPTRQTAISTRSSAGPRWPALWSAFAIRSRATASRLAFWPAMRVRPPPSTFTAAVEACRK